MPAQFCQDPKPQKNVKIHLTFDVAHYIIDVSGNPIYVGADGNPPVILGNPPVILRDDYHRPLQFPDRSNNSFVKTRTKIKIAHKKRTALSSGSFLY
ncbi:MAG: hypothetical protein FWD71_15485 [Oscillospiraceae bacterium]|nr:hypothetical protein [Oscillospiraceae bacterium]